MTSISNLEFRSLSEIIDQLGHAQSTFPLFQSTVTNDVWKLKYRRRNEGSIIDTLDRVGNAFRDGPGDEIENMDLSEAVKALIFSGIFFPAGRVIAGAGLEEHDSTLMNCYVMGTLPDSLDGIMDSLRDSAKTQKYGGGIGVDFTPLRPKGSEVSTAAFFAGGPVAFMGLWDAMGHALEAGGNRRGGKMATLADHHPDILEFVEAKSKHGKLTSFNVSVLISDAFMQAVEDDADWVLHHSSPRQGEADTQEMIIFETALSTTHYVWDRLPARKLWDAIMENTYHYSEPGVIFIDRMNDMNPINYAEEIRCTNPCGEQPLPPYGACDLGQINLARLVLNPFTDKATFNYNLLEYAVQVGIIALDKVLDMTKYPLHQQYKESMAKRRIGLGITGLADCLTMLGAPYDSNNASEFVDHMMSVIKNTAYITSASLAEKYGAFPLMELDKHMEAPYIRMLDLDVKNAIRKRGLRNSLTLSIAPTGTVSILFGDVSGGCEPHFLHKMERKIKVKDASNNDVFKPYNSYSYAIRMFAHVHGMEPEYVYQTVVKDDTTGRWRTADMISPKDHVAMQGLIQKHVDASISKTVNCPEDTTFEAFKEVYRYAYGLGCKGCATYRPSDVRDGVLGAVKEEVPPVKEVMKATHDTRQRMILPPDWKREGVLQGVTHKLRWPGLNSPVFVTINHLENGQPIEVFIASKNDHYNEWSVAMSVMISKLLQANIPYIEVAAQLREITMSNNGAYMDGRHYGSIICKIGELIENHIAYARPARQLSAIEIPLKVSVDSSVLDKILASESSVPKGVTCSFCGSANVQHKEGCLVCMDCHNSKCA